jgi:hypothetical protein
MRAHRERERERGTTRCEREEERVDRAHLGLIFGGIVIFGGEVDVEN